MASIHQDERTKNWIVMFRYGGKQFRRSTETRNRKRAEGIEARIEETLRLLKLGRIEIPSDADPASWIMSDGKRDGSERKSQKKRLTLGQLCNDYLDDQQSKAQTTMVGERIHIRHLKSGLQERQQAQVISVSDLQAYASRRLKSKYRGKPISGSTVRKELVTFRQIWDWGRQRGFVDGECPIYGDHGGRRWIVSIPKPAAKEAFQTWDQIERRIKRGGLSARKQKELWDRLFLDEKQIIELLKFVKSEALHSFIHPMFVFAAYTGARRGEIRRSEIEDFDFSDGQLKIRERKRRKDMAETFRFVPIHSTLKDVMQEWFEEHPGGPYSIATPMVMPRRKARTEFHEMTAREAHHHFKHTLKNSKWSVLRGFHVLRHSFGSNLARSGRVPRDVIGTWMGHSTEEMKDLYQHLFPEDGQSQIEVLQ